MVSFPPTNGALITSVVRSGHMRNLNDATCCRRREPVRRALHQLLRKRAPAEQLARRSGSSWGYLGSLLRPTLLAMDLVEAILNGRASRAVTLQALLNIFLVEWLAQATVASSRDP